MWFVPHLQFLCQKPDPHWEMSGLLTGGAYWEDVGSAPKEGTAMVLPALGSAGKGDSDHS